MNQSREAAPVVVGVDSHHGRSAVRWAAGAAARREAPLLILHATGFRDSDVNLTAATELHEGLRDHGTQLLRTAADIAGETAGITARTDLISESPAIALLQAAPTSRMLVLGASGPGATLASTLLGSTAAQVVAHAEAPVVIVRGQELDRRSDQDPVVVGVDGSAPSAAAIGYAYEEAALRKAPLIAVFAWPHSESVRTFSQGGADLEPIKVTQDRVLAEQLAPWSGQHPGVTVERRVVLDTPRHALLELGRTAQLLVVGSRGRGGFTGLLLGSTSQALIHHAACPVMVVHHRDDD